ncbi:MAG: RNA 2',3'-cyclic phosphodiesterase [Proteobacteria bacterium]|nr:RNA 2',3'-cyclic phosphodiesterase [Pseudomonadota bacterium]
MPVNAQQLDSHLGAAPYDATLRLFFALWPPSALRAKIAQHALLWGFEPPERSTVPDKLHLTVLFMDGVSKSHLQDVVGFGAKIACEAQRFTLQLDRAEIWAKGGIAHLAPSHLPGELTALRVALARAAQKAGIPCDMRPFRPHVTLARGAQASLPPEGFAPILWHAADLCLVRSVLGTGAYALLARWTLPAASSSLS